MFWPARFLEASSRMTLPLTMLSNLLSTVTYDSANRYVNLNANGLNSVNGTTFC